VKKKLQIKITEKKLTDEVAGRLTKCGQCAGCGSGSCTSCR